MASSSSRRRASCSASGESRRRAAAADSAAGSRRQLGALAQLAAEGIAAGAGLLGPVHRRIGAVDQRHRVGTVLGIDADAQAARERQRVAADVGRQRQRVEDLLGDGSGIAGARHLGEQDDELVAAVPAHRVRLAHRGLETAGGELQDPIADRVAERVVDLLEVVEVDEDHADPGRAALRHRDRVLQAVEHQGARRRPRELVVLGRAGQLVEAADGGLRHRVGVHGGLHQLGVDLEQLRGAQAAQLLLGLREVAAQAGEIGPDAVGLGVEQRQRAARGRDLRIFRLVAHRGGGRSRAAGDEIVGRRGRLHESMMPGLRGLRARRGAAWAGAERNDTYSCACHCRCIALPCRRSPHPHRRRTTPRFSTSSSSAPASPGSAPPITCSSAVRASATSSSRRATRSAARGICSAIPACAPTRTCTRSAIAFVRGPRRRRSPTGRRSCATSATPPPRPASCRASASATRCAAPSGRARRRAGPCTPSAWSTAPGCSGARAFSTSAPATTATPKRTGPNSPAKTSSPAASRARSSGPRISTSPASGWS